VYSLPPVADLGVGDGGPGRPLILGKKESQKKEKPARQAKKTPRAPLAQGQRKGLCAHYKMKLTRKH